ncbi:MAG TPA: prephenate dehydratase domain-containing protein [Verrucomicrobiales bacterium]|jgi:prephenate dehydratase|nr:prephenate dehydratase domain-containing protein [Verrucomicrobiales bacterium]
MSSAERGKVAYLGPKYTYSHEAAYRLFPSAELFYKNGFNEIFHHVLTGQMDYGVLPVENSSTGAIAETFQLLLDQNFESLSGEIKVKIAYEYYLPVRHNLLGRTEMDLRSIKTLYTHRQPELQCSSFIADKLSHVTIENTVSTSDAADKLLQDPEGACIGGDILAHEQKLVKLCSGIQDIHRNVTRFIAVSSNHEVKNSRQNKTTFAIALPDKTGMLVKALQLVAESGINLKNIKTLPIRDSRFFSEDFKDWFVIDVHGPSTSKKFLRFDRERKIHKDLILSYKFLGSYPAYEYRNEHTVNAEEIAKPVTGRVNQMLALIAQGESDKVEFKSTLRYDVHQCKVNRELTKVIAKTMAAFMNCSGGTLFIGIDDRKKAVGIDLDVQTLSKKDEDGFLSALYQSVVDLIGNEFCLSIEPFFFEYENKRVCAVKVKGTTKPAWLNDGSTNTLYIRAGNASRPLDPKEAVEYVMGRLSKPYA